MYSLISDGKVIATAGEFHDALAAAKALSASMDKGVSWKGKKGRMVSVWSGPVHGSKGVTKHATYSCGEVF